MARKVALLLVSLVMVVALLVVSCGPRASTPAPATPGIPTPAVSTPAAPAPVSPTPAAPTFVASTEKPKYGGTLTLIRRTNLLVFMPGIMPGSTEPVYFVYEMITAGDWTKGPAGTGETDFGEAPSETGHVPSWEYISPHLAESFETPEIGLWIFNIRKGVHWALNPNSEASRLVGGREFTADDFIFDLNLAKTSPNASTLITQPNLIKNATFEKTGPWQVTVRTPVDASIAYQWIFGGSGINYIWPKEFAEQRFKINDWRLTVGTGPYMLTDFVDGSAATLIRNPNYWQKNPVGPGKGDQLPYPDGLKILIVPDISTRLAAMRTAKADLITEIEGEDARSLIMTNPKIVYKRYLANPAVVALRTDKQDLPYKDKRVRQALQMAIDYEVIKKDLYEGDAEIMVWPVALVRGSESVYVPLEQLPEGARSLYQYNPERAKQLLAEAGYPKGFKAKIIVRTFPEEIDSAAIFKVMWAKIGVDLEILPREAAVFTSITNAKSHEEMIFYTAQNFTTFAQRYAFQAWRGPGTTNLSFVGSAYPDGKDPVIEAAFQEVEKNIIINYAKADQIMRDIVPYMIEQAYQIPRPTPYTYRLWQPWLKNYYGESSPKFWGPFPWIDQDLKEQMTGRR